MISKLSTLFCFLILSSGALFGQADPIKHKAGMEKLSFLLGDWGADQYAPDENGEFKLIGSVSPDTPDKSKLWSFKSIFSGNYYRFKGNVGYNFSVTIGYDQWREVYMMTALDDAPGLTDVYQGGFNEAGDLVLSNHIIGTHYVQNGKKFFNRMIFTDISQNGFSWNIEISNDGENWTLVSKNDFKK